MIAIRLKDAFPNAIEISDPCATVFRTKRNAFAEAFARASTFNLTLVLKPDHLWTAIVRRLCLSDCETATLMRSRLESLEEASTLRRAFSDAFERIAIEPADKKWCAVMQNSFSTSDASSLASGRIALMATNDDDDATDFDDRCDVRSVMLEGTIEDWESIEHRLRYLEKTKAFEDRLIFRMRKIAISFVATRQGKDARAFWSRSERSMGCLFSTDGVSRMICDTSVGRIEFSSGFLGTIEDENTVAPMLAWYATPFETRQSLEFFPSVEVEKKPSDSRCWLSRCFRL